MKSFFPCSTMTRLLLLFSISAVALLIDPIAGQPSSSSHDHHHRRRSPMGFQGVRGKRSTEAINNNNFKSDSEVNSTNHDESLSEADDGTIGGGVVRAAEDHHYLGGLPVLSLVKRAPVGFMGMRGKKDFELMEDTLPYGPLSSLTSNHESGNNGEEDYKKFLDWSSFIIHNNNPRPENSSEEDDITIGKYAADVEPEQEQQFNYDNRDRNDVATSSYTEDYEPRNKKLFFNLPYRFIPKRGPSGFMGMRGKKLIGSYKRGPSGFMGMRGKKSSSPLMALLMRNYDPESNDNDEDDYIEGGYSNELRADKRGPSGFMGMRGKKWNELVDYMTKMNGGGEKRSPKMGFHGMRGKRSPASFESKNGNSNQNYGYFSVMKKVPYEFRGKFVGVRGKKSGSGLFASDLQAKRTPSGFMGMRGKKS